MKTICGNTVKIISIGEIERLYGDNGHWFDRDSMSFFKTKLPAAGLSSPHGIFFVTSEINPSGLKMFSVRQLTDEGKISTLGDFHSYTRNEANKIARELAKKGYFDGIEADENKVER